MLDTVKPTDAAYLMTLAIVTVLILAYALLSSSRKRQADMRRARIAEAKRRATPTDPVEAARLTKERAAAAALAVAKVNGGGSGQTERRTSGINWDADTPQRRDSDKVKPFPYSPAVAKAQAEMDARAASREQEQRKAAARRKQLDEEHSERRAREAATGDTSASSPLFDLGVRLNTFPATGHQSIPANAYHGNLHTHDRVAPAYTQCSPSHIETGSHYADHASHTCAASDTPTPSAE